MTEQKLLPRKKTGVTFSERFVALTTTKEMFNFRSVVENSACTTRIAGGPEPITRFPDVAVGASTTDVIEFPFVCLAVAIPIQLKALQVAVEADEGKINRSEIKCAGAEFIGLFIMYPCNRQPRRKNKKETLRQDD